MPGVGVLLEVLSYFVNAMRIMTIKQLNIDFPNKAKKLLENLENL